MLAGSWKSAKGLVSSGSLLPLRSIGSLGLRRTSLVRPRIPNLAQTKGDSHRRGSPEALNLSVSLTRQLLTGREPERINSGGPKWQKEHTINVAKEVVMDFLRSMGTTLPAPTRDAELEAGVMAITHTWPFEHQIRQHIVTGVSLSETSYAHISNIENRVAIAIYTALTTALDDPKIFESVGAQDFCWKIVHDTIRSDSGFLGQLARVVGDLQTFYSTFSASSIVVSTLQFLQGEMISGNPNNNTFVKPDTKEFLDYVRNLNGDGEAYAAFIWSNADFPGDNSFVKAIPDARLYFNFTNDILSFYKEEMKGEVDNYVHTRARITEKAVVETLHDVVRETVAAAERVRRTLGEGRARGAWDRFEQGFIRFHLRDPRYRLQDVLGAHWDYLVPLL